MVASPSAIFVELRDHNPTEIMCVLIKERPMFLICSRKCAVVCKRPNDRGPHSFKEHLSYFLSTAPKAIA